MPRIIDLSLPVQAHWRWKTEVTQAQSFERGDFFQTSRISMSCHSFTHVDSPLHFVPGERTVGQMDLENWVGEAAVVDLSHTGANHGVTVADLEQYGSHIRPGDIAILKTCWDKKCDINTREFWLNSPYVTREAAVWLHQRGVKCVGYDFPPDYAIREEMEGGHPEADEFITHDVFLRERMVVVEYLANLDQVTKDRIFLVVLPINLADCEGAPARAIALEME